jgi:hypothetical protein
LAQHRERGALGKGHQASEGRLDPDTNYIFQLRSHLVGERVSRCLKNFVFGRIPIGLNEVASGVNGEIVAIHAATHDLNLVPVLDPVHVLDQIACIDNRGLWSAKLYLGEATRSWLLNANAPATEATLGNPFKNPAHQFTGPGKSE